jgi:hypothetical protein
MNKIGVLTSLEANHGSCIFNISLNQLLRSIDNEIDVEFLDFLNCKYRTKETLRALKPNFRVPFFNLRRALTLSKSLIEATKIKKIFKLKTLEGLFEEINLLNYSTLIVSKVVWDLSKDALYNYPNVYWLSKSIKANKIAYAVSGHRTNLELLITRKEEIFRSLSGYKLIGVRDEMTQTMMEEIGINKITPVFRVMDPAFFYESITDNLTSLKNKYKISSDRNILGLLFYGKRKIAKMICDLYHKRGYQIISFNMFNPYADINIGHLVNPNEWFELIRLLSFCITDRFHVSAICLRENIPFVAIEPYQPKTQMNSKIFSLLKDFGVEGICYQNPYHIEFDLENFLSICDQVKSNWNDDVSEIVNSHLLFHKKNNKDFLKRMAEVMDS